MGRTAEERQKVAREFDHAQAWAVHSRRPLYLGEFGSYDKADYAARVRYTRFVRGAIEADGFAWAYWDLASHFGIYDPGNHAWRTELRDALLH